MRRPQRERRQPIQHLFTLNADAGRAQENPAPFDFNVLFPKIESVDGGRGGGYEGGNGSPPGWWRDGPFEHLQGPRCCKVGRRRATAADQFEDCPRHGPL